MQYPHQVSSYWAMYHALRDNDKLVASQPWQWYLDMAAKTITGMWQQARWYRYGDTFSFSWAFPAQSPCTDEDDSL